MYARPAVSTLARRVLQRSSRPRMPVPAVLPLPVHRTLASKPPTPPPSGLVGMPPPPPAAKKPPAAAAAPPMTPPPPSSPLSSIIEVDATNFMALLKSPVPVILDCYATWCDPCKKLTPVLERIVQKYPGKLILGKLDVDKHQELAAQLNVASLPSVFGLVGGKLVDRFVGMPTEAVLAGFLDKMISASPAVPPPPPGPSPTEGVEGELAVADELLKTAGDKQAATEAGAIYKRVYEELSREETPPPYLQARALAGLAKCALASGAAGEATQLLQLIKTKHKAEMESVPEVAAAVSFVEVALQAPVEEEGVSADDTIKALQAQVQTTPTDLEARHKLALKYFQLQRFEAAMTECLEIIKRDKGWNDGAAKALLLKVFEALGPTSELTKKGRQRMTNYLFL